MLGGFWQDIASTRRLSEKLEQMYLPSDSRLDLPGRGHCSSWILINGGRGGKMWALSSHSLGHYLHQAWALGQIWHRSKSLSNVAYIVIKFVRRPARRMKVHCLNFCVCRQDDQSYSNVCNVKKIFIYQVSEGLPLQSFVESLCFDWVMGLTLHFYLKLLLVSCPKTYYLIVR